jgi:hypothetical protein
MIAMISGAAALLAGAVSFSLFRYRTSDKTDANCLRKLSESAQDALDAVCTNPNPSSGPEVSVSWRDLHTIFRISRQLVMVTNRARLGHTADQELPHLLDMLQEDHAKLRWLLFLVAIESFVGRLGLGSLTHYTREVLWTYGEELVLLDQISQKCGPMEGHAIRAIS